jgi:hypothetical protein
MDRRIVELRILPPFAIGRLGSSPEPMDNYDLEIRDPIGWRQIVPAKTLVVDRETGIPKLVMPTTPVKFRDDNGRIRPVSPFLEVWARFAGEPDLVPLTARVLEDLSVRPDALRWRAHVANIKIFRRTGDTNDKIEAQTPEFSDHGVHQLHGECKNFIDKKTILLGTVQYVAPTDELPEIRLRFTPAAGRVYGPLVPGKEKDPNVFEAVYDTGKGTWKGYKEPDDATKAPKQGRLQTNPAQIFAGESKDGFQISWGYFDDECDGIVEVSLGLDGAPLKAFARIAAGPPTFAPDSVPVRTCGDEMEQALYGPAIGEVTEKELSEVRDVVRRALETVRLMNTGEMNKSSRDRGVGMARMDALDVNRALEPIFEPSVADALAIRSRHERVLLALESGSLAWFGRILRDYDKVGDLSTENRRKMPAMMRNADGRHLALTRRQVSKVRAAAQYVIARYGEAAK